MKLTAIKTNEVPAISKDSKYLELALEFVASDMKAVKITPEANESGNAIQSGFRNIVKTHNLPVDVALRKDIVYLVKKEEEVKKAV